jgi:hypothetical protein
LSSSTSTRLLFSSGYNTDADAEEDDDDDDDEKDEYPTNRELADLESLEQMLAELEQDLEGVMYDNDDDDDQDDMDAMTTLEDEEKDDVQDLLSLLETTGLLPLDDDDDGNNDDDDNENRKEKYKQQQESLLLSTIYTKPTDPNMAAQSLDKQQQLRSQELLLSTIYTKPTDPNTAAQSLESALREGVVPADAGVGSNILPGDWGWDPLDVASKDYILQIQSFLLRLLPGGKQQSQNDEPQTPYILPQRPTALMLRDYREAEIRHGRLAMLAAMIWPVQEMLDRLLLEPDQFGPLLWGPVTLPYFPLFMTLCMMGLGYLDIYAVAIKDRDEIGEAFLPGDCFWDPLSILEGAPASMKRNMQERELFNGRVAMLAIAAFLFEEGTTHLPLISIEGNELLLEPAYEVPFIQEWLDLKFAPSIYNIP